MYLQLFSKMDKFMNWYVQYLINLVNSYVLIEIVYNYFLDIRDSRTISYSAARCE